jgi:hypothetical protein
MKLHFSATDGTQDNAFSLDLDPAQFRGSRSAFGAQFHVSGLLEYDREKVVPLEMGGVLSWHADDSAGLIIPRQPVNGGTTGLTIPISDAQLAGVEERRAGAEANLAITLAAIARSAGNGVASYRLSWSPQSYVVPRDRWKDAVAACGFGRVHIVELPVPTDDAPDAWSRSAQMLARASSEFGAGRYGETMGNARNALQELVGVLERSLALEPKTPAFAERVQALGNRLKEMHERRGADPYSVLASVIRAVFDFSSDAVHRGYDVPSREDAAFALWLATALHAFVARRPFPKPITEVDASKSCSDSGSSERLA